MRNVQNVTISVSTPKPGIFVSRVVPDTDFARYPAAGYPANNFAKYRVSGEIVKYRNLKKKNFWKFLVSGRYFTLILYLEKGF